MTHLPVDVPPVLIADDSADDQDLLMSLLKKAKIPNPVFAFADGDSLMRFLHGVCEPEVRAAMRPCLLFLDLNMPGKSGLDIAREIREHPKLRHLTIVLLPGAIADEERRRAIEYGISRTICKFPQPDAFAELVGSVTATYLRDQDLRRLYGNN